MDGETSGPASVQDVIDLRLNVIRSINQMLATYVTDPAQRREWNTVVGLWAERSQAINDDTADSLHVGLFLDCLGFDDPAADEAL